MTLTVHSPTERCEIELPLTDENRQAEFCGVPLSMIGAIYVGGASRFAGLREVVPQPAPRKGELEGKR